MPTLIRLTRQLASLVTLLLLATMASAALIPEQWPALSVPPAPDAFFTPPSTLPAGNPGDVIRYRQIPTAPVLSVTNRGAISWQVMYLTTNARGVRNAVTGVILVPLGRNPATAPVVGFGAGTKGMADTCAPSILFSGSTDYDHLFINTALEKGWAVAISDYEGLGTPGDHPYVVGQSLGRSVIDSVRAAQRLVATGLRTDAKVVFWGYSEGGNSTAWAAQLQPTYAPEMKLVGVASGGVPADLLSVARANDGTIAFGTLLMAGIGLDAAYPELQLNQYLNANGLATVDAVRTQCADVTVPLYAFRHLSNFLIGTDPLTTPAWQARLAENKLGAMPPKVPMFLYHGTLDEAVNYEQAKALRDTYCNAGVRLQWGSFIGEHLTAGMFGQNDAVTFLSKRLAGETTPNSCPWIKLFGD